MAIGPVEYAVIAFPGNRFNGDVVPALSELVENDTVHIIDPVSYTHLSLLHPQGDAGQVLLGLRCVARWLWHAR